MNYLLVSNWREQKLDSYKTPLRKFPNFIACVSVGEWIGKYHVGMVRSEKLIF